MDITPEIEIKEHINGKEVSFFFYFYGRNFETYEHNFIENSGEFEPIKRIVNEVGEANIKKWIMDLVLINFLKCVQENARFIKYPKIILHIKIISQSAIAQYHSEVSGGNQAFFTFDFHYLMYLFNVMHFSKNPQMVQLVHLFFSYDNIFMHEPRRLNLKGSSLYKTTEHELFHYLDDRKVKEIALISGRLSNVFRTNENILDINPYEIWFGLSLRMEGVARFFENRRKRFILYKREYVPYYYLKTSEPNYFYETGSYMCYFVALARLYDEKRTVYNSLRIYFDKGDFLFFAEGIGQLLDRLPFQSSPLLENIPEKTTLEVCEEILELSHIKFIKRYEESCKLLKIPKDQVIITMTDFNAEKKRLLQKFGNL